MPSKKKSKNAKKGSKKDRAAYRETANAGHDMMTGFTRKCSDAQLNTEAQKILGQLSTSALSAGAASDLIKKLAVLVGTDVDMNDKDPYGDGDQREVGASGMEGEPSRQILRRLWSTGGDLEHYLIYNGYSPFMMACVVGNLKTVKRLIIATSEGELGKLLERRETGMRMTPLLVTLALSKVKSTVSHWTRVREVDMNHVGVIKLLLFHGARPDCKELTGKTIIHYGAGSHASAETLKVAGYCFDATKTSAYFGKKVILRNLKNEEYNGLTGTLGGYVAVSGRRQVTLDTDDEKKLALLPKNIFSYREDEEVCIFDESRNLLNERDRVGSTSLAEVFMSQRVDVAEWLIARNVSVDLPDPTGTTVRKMANSRNPFGVSTMNDLIRKYIKRVEKVERNRCWECKRVTDDDQCCSRCKLAVYCSRECQTKHWPSHKADCKKPQEDYFIQISRPDPVCNQIPLMNLQNIDGIKCAGEYRRPNGVNIDEQFWMKVQPSGLESGPHLVYDKSRSCTFGIMPGTPGYNELNKKVSQDSAFNGTKSYFKAAFGADGNCKIFPNISSTVKSW